MDKDIETYLKQLQGAMASAGADLAMVQDALFDAEEHLQSEMAAGGQFAAVAQAYGSPEEVAAAYLGLPVSEPATPAPGSTVAAEPAGVHCPQCGDQGQAGQAYCRTCGGELPTPAQIGAAGGSAEHQPQAKGENYVGQYQPGVNPPGRYVQPTYGTGPQSRYPYGVQSGMAASAAGGGMAAPSILRSIFAPFADSRVWSTLVYMILSLATGVAYFTIVVTGLSTAGGMLVLIVGIPLFMLVLGIVRGMALFEGRLVEALLGERMPRRLRATPPTMGFLERMGFWLKDGRTWASIAYMLLMLPLGIVYFTVAVTGLAVGVSLVTAPLWGWFQWHYAQHTFVVNGITYDAWPLWAIPIAFVAGLLLLIGFMHLVKWIGRGHAAFAKAMLVRLN